MPDDNCWRGVSWGHSLGQTGCAKEPGECCACLTYQAKYPGWHRVGIKVAAETENVDIAVATADHNIVADLATHAEGIYGGNGCAVSVARNQPDVLVRLSMEAKRKAGLGG